MVGCALKRMLLSFRIMDGIYSEKKPEKKSWMAE
jgi:hypothetical protein